MIVMKFGGTSTEDAAAMRNVLRIVQAHHSHQPALVISAIARATNELEQISRSAALGRKDQALELLASLRRRHEKIVAETIVDRERKADLHAVLSDYCDGIAGHCIRLASVGSLTAKAMDAICSFGERMSSRVVAAILEENGIGTAWVDAADFMATDDNFGRARPLLPEVGEKLERIMTDCVSRGLVPVTQGFIGVTAEGDYTTMGRESSDYSATLIGSLLGAEKVQIWTDVDGILSGDPRTLKGVRKVRRMSFDEALHLSAFGAKVLHPTTMLPLIQKGIPLEILNSKRDGVAGTLLGATSLPARSLVKSIAHKRSVQVVRMRRGTSRNGWGWEGISNLFAEHGLNVLCSTFTLNEASLLTDKQQMGDELLAAARSLGEVTVEDEKSSVTLVGDGVGRSGAILSRLTALCAGEGISMIAGSAAASLTIVIDSARLTPVLQSLHREWIEAADDPEIFEPVS